MNQRLDELTLMESPQCGLAYQKNVLSIMST
jgi:hypothetical protein